MTTTAEKGSSADGVSWDLGDLYAGPDDPKIGDDLEAAHGRARSFESRYRGAVDAPGGPSAETLLEALVEVENLCEQMDRPAVYASLLHAARTDDPERGKLMARVLQKRTEINKHLIFFDLEWLKVADEPVRELLASPMLAKYRHLLEEKRVWKPHTLTEPEEKILDEKSVTGRAAFTRLFEETTSAMKFPFTHKGETKHLAQQQILAKLYDADRSAREAGAAGLTHGLKENARLLGYILNVIVRDHRSDCTLRHFADPMDKRNLANEIDGRVVTALMSAVERYFPTVQRYYRLKGKLLGLDKLTYYDRYAPLFADQPTCDWDTARKIVGESYHAFSKQAGGIVDTFFEQRWIDAELRPGKRGGAFSAGGVPSVHPYILMSFTDKLRDVMTLAHELGHGVHQYLSRDVGYLQCHTPLTTAEMASVFGEMLTFTRLQQIFPQPRTRLALLCSKIEDGFATVFRQVVLTRFEQSVHQAQHEQGELSVDELNELWLKANAPMHGDVIEMPADYGWWWSYIGHFINSPFYCYAYAFGELLVLALVQKYKQEGAAFVPRYLEMLASGGSDAPHVLLAKLGVDVTDPTFWELGLRLLDDMVGDAEQLAGQIG
jgi:oligoendopeptidase F